MNTNDASWFLTAGFFIRCPRDPDDPYSAPQVSTEGRVRMLQPVRARS